MPTIDNKSPSISQPPELVREKMIETIERLIASGNESAARQLDEQQKIGYFASSHFVTRNPAMLKLKDKVRILSKTQYSVLIQGESGTGKELIARELHGIRPANTFMGINCAGLPEQLLESELFGYTEGSFTGAAKGGRQGLILAAGSGTVFLDEIGDMPLPMQAKLLRVLQERTVRRVGSEQVEPIACRFVAATHHDLRYLVIEGRFRLDLYKRLSVVTLSTSPLRNRPEDIPLIIQHLNELHGAKFPSAFDWITYIGMSIKDDTTKEATYKNWLDGNVRDLESFVINHKLFGELPSL